MRKNIHIGIDIGSISIKLCFLTDDDSVIHQIANSQLDKYFKRKIYQIKENESIWFYCVSHYLRHQGKPRETIKKIMGDLRNEKFEKREIHIF